MEKLSALAIMCLVPAVMCGCNGYNDYRFDQDYSSYSEGFTDYSSELNYSEFTGESSNIETSMGEVAFGLVVPTQIDTPVVKDGVTILGEDSILVTFEWDKISGADGYEVCEENKYCSEESYREPEYNSTLETSYTTGAQDDFDFRIKVRAYKGDGASREYSQWSEYATGSTYDK